MVILKLMKLTKLSPYRGSPEGRKPNNFGFTILFAILASAALLIMALGITNITYKEIILSGSAREAGHALFAADTGVECALYWRDTFIDGLGSAPECVSRTVDNFSPTPLRTTFDFEDASGHCAEVSVTPEFSVGVGTETFMQIISTGYNVDCLSISNKRAVSRVIEVLL
ncbi:hypothetical protein A3I25_02065 [Candidatus Nomurabacteria bacterium RIFCSPLOWO2_02_FULL_42_17]|uniref:Type 4 fimbrial biogenesis protein PilX N-terminal domain-containing protein n=2 Tax=Candidatus Nomuraibacteriota TaxID=1752729 RepID=A0A1F6WLW2_9BACT|nr:MAG: hypothetical protein A3B93_02235 [Candidatus Nomurabacteria bacterium RIFCSPHIGHO2_02_FULL_42_24]OGI97097.1 MAG: hypothetical protein A3I25_02065 [Candidatus Nomurabacteria bacterium RIFCSPLOWO2_02_FULL_42_17]